MLGDFLFLRSKSADAGQSRADAAHAAFPIASLDVLGGAHDAEYIGGPGEHIVGDASPAEAPECAPVFIENAGLVEGERELFDLFRCGVEQPHSGLDIAAVNQDAGLRDRQFGVE